ncbi:hypothetical protein Nepgr_010257 [Nepenthes gracilis]|uniref:Membrane-associated kinase regulator 1 n=1 Tax=Nepenthes gracilis TaxID=150966 RepID=A0AAD3SD21_NEPGR|nr:hypothetical protein Nepgr_010257 [Nepenthes gracilis]
MGKKTEKNRSKTLPSSPTHSFSSSSSSDFEFRISLSPRKSFSNICPADELFYKGQLLPLQLSPRISMVRTLLLASSSTSSSSDSAATASRDSSSSTDSNSSFASDLVLLAAGDPCVLDSSRPSSVAEDDELKRLNSNQTRKKAKYFSLSRFSNVFKKEPKARDPDSISASSSSVKRMSSSAKEMIRKYLKKVKPLYEKMSQKQPHQTKNNSRISTPRGTVTFYKRSVRDLEASANCSTTVRNGRFPHSFSGNLWGPRRSRRSYVSSCPSSIRSSPSHSGILSRSGLPVRNGRGGTLTPPMYQPSTSTMEELQSAIQGAIAHCKNSHLQNSKGMAVSNEAFEKN